MDNVNMSGKLTQPKVAYYLRWLSRNDHHGTHNYLYDGRSNELLDELFSLLKTVTPIASNGARTLWLRAERGSVEDFGNAEELIAEGDYLSEEDFLEDWKASHPNEIEWYELSGVDIEDENYRALTLGHKFIIAQSGKRPTTGFESDISELMEWIVAGVKDCISMIQAGTYNDFIRDNLPPQHRTGTISRNDFWSVWPENRDAFFENISKADVREFIRLAYAQKSDAKQEIGRLPSMTANAFFRYCAMGYAANEYKGGDKSPKDQYLAHADGRDEGLCEIDPDDPSAFLTWHKDTQRYGGHPWEVCRGGNSTHVSLYVLDDANGYYLHLAGSAVTRTIETVKFFLALRRAGIPVYLNDAPLLAKRMDGTEKIGIVPEGVTPAYCGSLFPGEDIICYRNLPYEDREKFLPFCTWYEEPRVSLLPKEE